MNDHRTIRPRVLYFGTPIALITTTMPDGRATISPMSSVWALDDRLLLGLGTDGQCLSNLERERSCVVNLPDARLWREVDRLAPTTARLDVPEAKRAMGYVFEADKFGRSGLHPVPSDTVPAPRIDECPLQLEAELLCVHAPAPTALGEIPDFRIVEVRVTAVHAHADITRANTDHVDVERWKPLLYVFRRYVGAGAVLGQNFRAE
jgi:flavin reductase (DIM6/NTAB) family NADH-FMN oxidoreductase RutF